MSPHQYHQFYFQQFCQISPFPGSPQLGMRVLHVVMGKMQRFISPRGLIKCAFFFFLSFNTEFPLFAFNSVVKFGAFAFYLQSRVFQLLRFTTHLNRLSVACGPLFEASTPGGFSQTVSIKMTSLHKLLGNTKRTRNHRRKQRDCCSIKFCRSCCRLIHFYLIT